MTSPAAHHAQQVLTHLKALKDATAHPVGGVQGLTIGNHSTSEKVDLIGTDYYEIINTLALCMAELAPTLRQLLFSLIDANKEGGLTTTPSGDAQGPRKAATELNSTITSVQNTYKALARSAEPLKYVVDSDRRQPSERTMSERDMAVAYVRGSFFPPLPKAYAQWLIELRNLTREGVEGDALLEVPAYIQDTCMIPRGARTLEDGRLTITLYDALAALRQTDLLDSEDEL